MITDHGQPTPIEDVPVRPTWVEATRLAGIYLVLAGAYVFFSTRLARETAASADELARIETLKGLIFVGVTAAVLWLLNFVQLARVRRRDTQFRRMDRALQQAERSVLLGTFAGTVAHDLNNGLMVASVALEELREDVAKHPELLARADEARVAVQRVSEWNRRYFDLGGQKLLGELLPFDLAAMLRSTFEMSRRHRAFRDRDLTADLPSSAPFRGSEAMLQRAVLNLLLNAAEATTAGGKVHLALERVEFGRYCIAVDDNGPGVPEDMREKVLEPFYTSKREGTGLGLASVLAAANLHHGAVEIGRSTALGGARFTVTLP